MDRLALAALDRDLNTVKDYDIEAAIRLVTLKLVGYTEVVHALLDRLTPDASVLLYGGLAKLRPYPGSTTITTINHGVDGLVRTMAAELPPIRVNALHPGDRGRQPVLGAEDRGARGDEGEDAHRPAGRDARRHRRGGVPAGEPSMHGTELRIDGGWSLT